VGRSGSPSTLRVTHGSKTDGNHAVRHLTFLIILFALQQPRLPQEDLGGVAGCYDVELGEWTPDLGPQNDSLLFAPPSRVVLDTVQLGLWGPVLGETWRSLRVAKGALPSIHDPNRTGWRTEGDSVRLGWGAGTGAPGLRAAVGQTPEGFSGWVRTVTHDPVTDPPRETRTAPITLRRVSCDSPPRITALDQRQLLTSVSFSDGTRIALDVPFIPGPGWEEKTDQRFRRFVLRNPEIDCIGPVLSVEFWPARGETEGRIDVHFLPTEDFEAEAQKVIDEIGEPTRTSERIRDEVRTADLSWENHTHRVTLRGTRAPGGLWEIVLYLSARYW
ncbi:MAG: hypothetical protein MUO50_11600, partial [Longimicrobiales bacterium]|nr:hypothetical protein [Longimicrobiales bacterium]